MVSPLSASAVAERSEANKSAMASWDDAVREVRPLRKKLAGQPGAQRSSNRRAVTTVFSAGGHRVGGSLPRWAGA